MSNMEDLEKRIQVLEDIEAIKKMKVEYMRACDDAYNPEAIAALFTEDCVWECNSDGIFYGKEELKAWFRSCAKNTSWAMHYAIAPIIEVNGNTADGKWYMWMLATNIKHGPCLYAVTYVDKYEKVDGKWLCKDVRVTNKFACKYEEGWVKDPWGAYR